ncbi:MAG: lipid A deacylase LpxR family protein [Gemmatimonadota bacterium]
MLDSVRRTLRRDLRLAIMMSCTATTVTVPLGAQVMTRVDLDNDSFNFWQAPKRRADREYTQGTRIQVLWPSDGRLVRRLLGGAQQCSVGTGDRDCRMVSLAATQAIYTPNLDQRRRTAFERPYAGWLGAELGVQRDRERSLTALGISLGVTGKASLAEPGQKAVHKLFGFRPPIGWDGQLPSEVAVMATYRGAQALVRRRHQRSGLGLIIAPEWRARVGTVATDATVGMQVVFGIRPPLPWNTAASSEQGRWGLFLRAGAAQHAVARNLFLDGTTFSDSRRVSKRPTFGETELGLGLRLPGGVVEWRVHSLGREYELQPRPHAYSTLAFSVR